VCQRCDEAKSTSNNPYGLSDAEYIEIQAAARRAVADLPPLPAHVFEDVQVLVGMDLLKDGAA
jgi:hypothetical protein